MNQFKKKKMEIGESFFWKKHGKLAHLRILAPKIFPECTPHNTSWKFSIKPYVSLLVKHSKMVFRGSFQYKFAFTMQYFISLRLKDLHLFIVNSGDTKTHVENA